MELKIIRDTFTEKSTIGKMYVDGPYFCYTLEDVVREAGVKVPGKTAIPEGRYKVIIDQSARFQRAMPHILDVPGFEGIRIHAGNRAEDTEGCILLGFKKDINWVGESRLAFNQLFDRLHEALIHEECWITVEKEVANA